MTEPGDEIIVFAPYFPEYRPYAQGAGLRLSVVPADVDSFQINFRALEERLNPAVTALLINSPNNPSGIVLSSATLTQLAALLEEKQRQFGHPIYLISDEPYRELLFTGTEETYPARFYDNTITCYSFSKSLSLPGERIGYLAVNPKAEQAMTIAEVCPQISRTIGCNGTSTLMQLTVGRCADLTSQLEIYERNKDRLFSALTEYGFSCVRARRQLLYVPPVSGTGRRGLLQESDRAGPVSGARHGLRLPRPLPAGLLRTRGAGGCRPAPVQAAGGAVSETGGLKYFLYPSFKSNLSTA